jgi:hypothetical protein
MTIQRIKSQSMPVRPWNAGHAAGRISGPLCHNGRPYTGINVLSLWASATVQGFVAPIWMTYRQALELDAQVRKGEKGSPVAYSNTLVRNQTDADSGIEVERHLHFFKAYTAFNVEQIDGFPNGARSICHRQHGSAGERAVMNLFKRCRCKDPGRCRIGFGSCFDCIVSGIAGVPRLRIALLPSGSRRSGNWHSSVAPWSSSGRSLPVETTVAHRSPLRIIFGKDDAGGDCSRSELLVGIHRIIGALVKNRVPGLDHTAVPRRRRQMHVAIWRVDAA